jgi:hypothetical protein
MIRLLLPTLLAATACATPTASPPLPAHVITFASDGSSPAPAATISDHPTGLTDLGWRPLSGDADAPLPPPEPGHAYLALTASTGCRTPIAVEVRRVEDDLRVAFTGGEDHPECVRPIAPAALLDLAPADVAGVRTVNGRPIRK